MMHQLLPATRRLETPTALVVTVDGDPDRLAFYGRASSQSWLAMDEPLDVRDYR